MRLGRVFLLGSLAASMSFSTVQAAPTLVNLTANLSATIGAKFCQPYINNLGHVVISRSTTSAEGGAPYFWNGSGNPVVVPGVSQSDPSFDLRLNDQDRILYTKSGAGQVIIADPNGLIHTFDDGTATFIAGFNDESTVIRISTTNGYYYNGYISEDPYDTDTLLYPSGTNYNLTLGDINNNDQILKRYNSKYYVDNVLVVATKRDSDQRNIYFNDKGQVLGRGIETTTKNTLYLNEQPIYTGQLVRHWLYQPNPSYSKWYDSNKQIGMSDDGSKVVWCEWVGEVNPDNGSMDVGHWDVFTFIDGIPTNITNGSLPAPYNHCMDPSINNQGQITFAAVPNGDGGVNYSGDVFLWYDDELTEPTVYNGHFNGNTLFGWDIDGAGTASTTMLGTDDYAAQLTTGSPISISQLVDTPSSTFTLDFLFDFQTTTGTLEVLLDGQVLATLTSVDDTEAGMVPYSIEISDPSLLGLTNATLEFAFDGDTGSIVLLDNVVMVPEPAAMVLFATGLFLLTTRSRA